MKAWPHYFIAFVICFRKYFPCQQRSSPGKWSVFEGRRSGMVGKKGGAAATWVNNVGSRRVQAREPLHALTFRLCFCSLCCSAMSAIHHKKDFYHLFLSITYPRMCCESMQHLQSKIAKQRSRWDSPPNTMRGISSTPPPPNSCNGQEDDLRPCNLSIISLRKGLFASLLTVPPELKLHDE